MYIVHVAGPEFEGAFRRCLACRTVLTVPGLDAGAFVETIRDGEQVTYLPLGTGRVPAGGVWMICTAAPKGD